MDRRELFKILAATAAASPASGQHPHGAESLDLASYKPRFFTAAEYEMLDRLCEIIIPADARSPGAQKAQVRFFIDVMVQFGDAQNQERWRAGLKAVDGAARTSFGKAFAGCSSKQQDAIVARMARNEGAPTNELERFFAPLKRLTVDGYHLSDVGAREGLGYKGDVSLTEFPGCDHPEHQS
jgi:gluconate 2-dehydrogenase gamma chain